LEAVVGFDAGQWLASLDRVTETGIDFRNLTREACPDQGNPVGIGNKAAITADGALQDAGTCGLASDTGLLRHLGGDFRVSALRLLVLAALFVDVTVRMRIITVIIFRGMSRSGRQHINAGKYE